MNHSISILLVAFIIATQVPNKVFGQTDTVSTLRFLTEVCKGECFYFEDGKDDSQPLPSTKVSAILSIERFVPSCIHAIQTNMNKMFCCEVGKGADLYRVKLARRLPVQHSCAEFRKNCIPTEFIAVAFSQDNKKTEEDTPYFTCTERIPWVVSVRQNAITTVKSGITVYTTPFATQAVSTFWSEVRRAEDDSLYCSFIISSRENLYIWNDDSKPSTPTKISHIKVNEGKSNSVNDYALDCKDYDQKDIFHYTDTTTSQKLPPRTFKFNNTAGFNIKVAKGRVNINIQPGSKFIDDVRIRETASQIVIPDLNKMESDEAKVWLGNAKFYPHKLPFPKPKQNKATTAQAAQTKIVKDIIGKVYRSCATRKSLCYRWENERGCMHKENCHLLVAITKLKKDFSQLHFDIISQTPEYPGEVRLVRPKGWAGFAFSDDAKMNEELVFTCSSFGNFTKVYVSLNLGRANLYFPTAAYQNKLKKTKTYVWNKHPHLPVDPIIMCSFDLLEMKFKFSHRPVANKESILDLAKKEYFILLAQGAQVGHDWSISYHGKINREVHEMKFSKGIYEQYTGGATASRLNMMMISIIFIIKIFLIHFFIY